MKKIILVLLIASSVLTAMSKEEFKASLEKIQADSRAKMRVLAQTPSDELMCEVKIRQSISAYRGGQVNEYAKCTSKNYFYMVNKNGEPYRYDRKSKVFSKIKID